MRDDTSIAIVHISSFRYLAHLIHVDDIDIELYTLAKTQSTRNRTIAMAAPKKLPIRQADPLPASLERVEAWAVSQTADILSATSISSVEPPRLVRGTSVKIDIPLDDSITQNGDAPRPKVEPVHTVYKRREPIRRDSLKRREALLKGKEGSRQRRRWENDRLLSNPYAQPPLPTDWVRLD